MVAAAAELLGIVFLVAGLGKLRDPAGARAAISAVLPRAPARAARGAAPALGLAELALGALLLSGLAPRASALGALLALGLFSGALLVLRGRAAEAGCGCFGGAGVGGPSALVRNAALAGLAVLLVVHPAGGSPWEGSPAMLVARTALTLGVLLGWSAGRGALGHLRGAHPRPPAEASVGPTRRGFLARAVAGAVVAGGAALLGDAQRALAAGAPGGCTYGERGVNVCWSPWRVRRSEPARGLPRGVRGVALRRGPSFAAPIVHVDGRPVIVPVGAFFGRQSRRDGGAGAGCPDPGPRAAAGRGFVFGYPALRGAAGGVSGWLPTEYRGKRLAEADPSFSGVLCGPEALDFDCRAGTDRTSSYRSACGPRAANGRRAGHVCGGSREDVGSCFPPHETDVRAVRMDPSPGREEDLSARRYLLRYTRDGTPIFWLVPGDRVRAFCVSCGRRHPDPACPPLPSERGTQGCCQQWSCVEVVRARWAPPGTRGWVDSSVLADGGTPPSVTEGLRQIVRDVFLV